MILRLNIDAFSLKPETHAAFAQAAKDSRMRRSRFTVHEGGIVAAAAYFAANPTPDVILVEETGSDQELMQHLEALASVVDPGVKVVVVGALNDISLYRTLVAQGIGEYLLSPPTAEQVLGVVHNLYSDPGSAPRGRTIAFYGARGGVGSSSIAHNVAWILSHKYKEPTILLDFDGTSGTANLDFNIEGKQHIAEVLAQWDRLDDVLFEKCLVAAGDHLKLLTSGPDLKIAPSPSPDAVEKVVDLAGATAGFVVLDIPHLWAEWTQAAMESVDDLVIVANPDLICLRECKALFSTLTARRGIKPTRLLLNKTEAAKKTELAVKDFEETTNARPVWIVPFAPDSFGAALNNGQMIGEIEKSGRTVESLNALTVAVSGRNSTAAKLEPKSEGILETLQALIDKGKGALKMAK